MRACCVAGCIVFLEYEPASYERTVLLVGKVSATNSCAMSHGPGLT